MTKPLTMMHVAHSQPDKRLWTNTFRKALEEVGTLEIVCDAHKMPEAEVLRHMRRAQVVITSWGTILVPEAIGADRGNLEYICHLTGVMRGMVPLGVVQSGILTTNWGNAAAFGVAEGAFTLLMAMLKNLRAHVIEKEAGHWRDLPGGAVRISGSLRNLNVGIYGLGFIGRSFCDMLRPFRPIIRAYDPFVEDFPADVIRVDSLEALFRSSHALVIHAGLTDQTTRSVTAELLKHLPDNAIVINTARGDIIDQDALFVECSTGRLRAGLDVMAGDDTLAPDHPARHWPNVILTGHQVGGGHWPISPEDPDRPLATCHEVCLDNLRRFAAGQPVQFVIDEVRYSRMS